MSDGGLDRMIDAHRQWTRWFLSVAEQAKVDHSMHPGQAGFVEDENQCELGKLLASGAIQTSGDFSLRSVQVLHGTFHSIAGLMLRAVEQQRPNSEILEYLNELQRVSSQLQTVLRSASAAKS